MNSNFSPELQLVRRANALRPNYSEVARELGVTPQHVRRVFLGLSTSARVMAALGERMGKKKRQRKGKAAEVAA